MIALYFSQNFLQQPKNDVHKSLYTATDSIKNFTKQALSIIFHNFMVCISRLLVKLGIIFLAVDFIMPLIQQTASCPKDNRSGEKIFAGLDYLRRKYCCFRGDSVVGLNKTSSHLDDMDHNRREKYLNDARKQRQSFLQPYQRKST